MEEKNKPLDCTSIENDCDNQTASSDSYARIEELRRQRKIRRQRLDDFEYDSIFQSVAKPPFKIP